MSKLYFYLFPQNLRFSFSQNLEGIRKNEIKFKEIFTKFYKIPLYIQLFYLKLRSSSNIVIRKIILYLYKSSPFSMNLD